MGNSKIYGGFLGVPNPKPDVNTNADIVNVYKFCGSVDKCENLPGRYEVIPSDAPYILANGIKQLVGTYNDDGTISFNSEYVRPISDEIFIPIKKITIQFTSDTYFCDDTALGHCKFLDADNKNVFRTVDCDATYGDSPVKLDEGTEIHTIVTDSFLFGDITNKEYTNLATILKFDANGKAECSNGDVYNVLDDGMNYAWTGTEWDALGGDHKDLEAREQIGDIETALDSIIEIQNSLIGGESV